MKCDIIIPVWNQLECTRRCIESIRGNTDYPYRLILIDNGSSDQTKSYLEEIARSSADVTLIRNDENLGFIRATNQGLRASDAQYVCLMNNDAEASRRWLAEMISVAESDPAIGLVNPKSTLPAKEGRGYRGRSFINGEKRFIETNQCMGYCMLIKREVLEKIGFLDEAYGVGGFDDTDFSRRAHSQGYKCVCARYAFVFHKWHTSFLSAGNREALVRKNEAIYEERWGRFLRIGFPISQDSREDFFGDIKTSLALAREWNWVHAWIRANGTIRKKSCRLGLPEHQNLRTFCMSGWKAFFYMEVLFRLLGRRMKNKKAFDAILVSDKKLARFLSRFERFFSFPVHYVERHPGSYELGDSDAEYWRRRARGIMASILKERSS